MPFKVHGHACLRHNSRLRRASVFSQGYRRQCHTRSRGLAVRDPAPPPHSPVAVKIAFLNTVAQARFVAFLFYLQPVCLVLAAHWSHRATLQGALVSPGKARAWAAEKAAVRLRLLHWERSQCPRRTISKQPQQLPLPHFKRRPLRMWAELPPQLLHWPPCLQQRSQRVRNLRSVY